MAKYIITILLANLLMLPTIYLTDGISKNTCCLMSFGFGAFSVLVFAILTVNENKRNSYD